MASTSARALALLSTLASRPVWRARELADVLEVSARTIRRDVETLRGLGYPITATTGTSGGYRLGDSGILPPLILTADQALATSIALRTAPSSIAGFTDHLPAALAALKSVMPPRLREQMDSLTFTTLRNYWEFPAPPADPDTIRDVGDALRRRHTLRLRRVEAEAPLLVEPHHLALWSGRWYLIRYVPDEERWTVRRIDGLRLQHPHGRPFSPRPLPCEDIAEFVASTADRGDVPDEWPCYGSATLPIPADVAARWMPGGGVVRDLGPTSCRLSIGAWSWAGVAGLFATYGCELSDIEPRELRHALHGLAERIGRGLEAS